MLRTNCAIVFLDQLGLISSFRMGRKSARDHRGTFNNGKARYRKWMRAKKAKEEQEVLETEQRAFEKRFRLEQKDAADELRRNVLGPARGSI